MREEIWSPKAAQEVTDTQTTIEPGQDAAPEVTDRQMQTASG